jgi:hypothetical protein
MSAGNAPLEVVDQLIARLREVSDRLSNEIEAQAGNLDRRFKDLVDRGEAATNQVVKVIDTELRGQVTALRAEVDKLTARIAALAPSGAKKTAAKRTTASKPATAKKTAANKPAGKKVATKKAAAKKTAAKKGAAKRRVAA